MDVKNVQNLTPAYKSTLGGTSQLRAAGGDVSTGCVAKHPVVSRLHRDAAAATHDDVVEAGRWVVRRR